MPYQIKSHILCRILICALCGIKNQKCGDLNGPGEAEKLVAMIRMYSNPDYDEKMLNLPAGICPTCKTRICGLGRGEVISIQVQMNWILHAERMKLLPRFRGDGQGVCTCVICSAAKSKMKTINIKDLMEYEKENELNIQILIEQDQICSECFATLGPGKIHPCNKADTISNLKSILFSKGPRTTEQVLSTILKDMREDQNTQDVKLSTLGKPLPVHVGMSKMKKRISSETLFGLKQKHDFSETVIDSIAAACRKDLGRSGVQSNSSSNIKEWSHSLDSFYSVEKIDFVVKERVGTKYATRTVTKDLVYVNDVTALVFHICGMRKIDPVDALVRVGIDGGGGSLKLIMNIFIPQTTESQKVKDTGVKKVIYIAAVKDIPESHHNMSILFEKTHLNDLKFHIASDLKLLNIILGISAHGGKHSCLYCNGTVDTPGELRTFGDLSKCYNEYKENGYKNMKQFDNVIQPCLLKEPQEKLVLDVIPPPELHLLMKIVTVCSLLLCNGALVSEWFKKNGISFHGYNGGGLDGRNSNKVLKKLNDLNIFVTENCPEYLPVVGLLFKFEQVVFACFGMNLVDGYQLTIEEFSNELKYVTMYVENNLNSNMRFGWKGHILLHHVQPFLDHTQTSLGVYSEQCSEAVHCNFKKTYQRYASNEDHEDHGIKLKKAVSSYSSMRI